MGETDEMIRPRTAASAHAIAHRYHGAPARHPQEPAAAPGPGSARACGGPPITVAIQATDPIVAAGSTAYLHTHPGITPLPAAWAHRADVVLVVADLVTEETLSWMHQAAEKVAGGQPRFVLVADGVRAPQLLRAVTCGLVSVLPRQGCDYEQIVQAILHVHEGRVELPGAALGALIASAPARREAISAPSEPASGALEGREVDVLRLLADGLGTPEIAQRLNYSERTVKNIIHGLLTRMNLRNRPHAVAFALRNGLL